MLAPDGKWITLIISGEKYIKSNYPDTIFNVPQSATSLRISWPFIIKILFNIDIKRYQNYGANMEIIISVLESSTLTKIFDHPGLS